MGKLLEVKNLKVQFETSDGIVKALNGIDISLDEGMTLGLVGETGAGKTTLAKSIMRIVPQPPGKIVSGEILYDGNDILKMVKMRSGRSEGAYFYDFPGSYDVAESSHDSGGPDCRNNKNP